MDYINAREAICEIEMDINEGADFIMIKPGKPYLDVIKTANSDGRCLQSNFLATCLHAAIQ
jgi:delta-aminolevulinic acid dehydratase/porphobilinogen synthase